MSQRIRKEYDLSILKKALLEFVVDIEFPQKHAQFTRHFAALKSNAKYMQGRLTQLSGDTLALQADLVIECASLQNFQERTLLNIAEERKALLQAARGEVVEVGAGVAEGEGAANVAGAGVVPNPEGAANVAGAGVLPNPEGAANVAGAGVLPNPVQSSERNGQQHRLEEALGSIDNANKRLARRLLATVAIISIAAIGIGLTIMPLAFLVIPISVIAGALYYFNNCEKRNGADAQPPLAAAI